MARTSIAEITGEIPFRPRQRDLIDPRVDLLLGEQRQRTGGEAVCPGSSRGRDPRVGSVLAWRYLRTCSSASSRSIAVWCTYVAARRQAFSAAVGRLSPGT